MYNYRGRQGYQYHQQQQRTSTSKLEYRCKSKIRDNETGTHYFKYDTSALKKIHYPNIGDAIELSKLLAKYKNISCSSLSDKKKEKCEKNKKDILENITKVNKSISKTLSSHLKARVTKKIEKLKNKAKTKRINSIACSLKYLIEILNDSNCSGGTKFSNLDAFMDSFKKYLSEHKKDEKDAKSVEFSIALLHYIITENPKMTIEEISNKITGLKNFDSNLFNYLKDFISSIKECSA